MASRVFVDTSGWYALIDRRDAGHDQISALVRRLIKEGARLVTTDYVIDESCTLTQARSGAGAAIRLLDLLEETAGVDVEWIGSDRFEAAKRIFRSTLTNRSPLPTVPALR
ncbi:MAG: PIN domain-containing protein [Gemmatimonas sp.]|nr:PIN domain-containing protein [Gemmatimonas sp.]